MDKETKNKLGAKKSLQRMMNDITRILEKENPQALEGTTDPKVLEAIANR